MPPTYEYSCQDCQHSFDVIKSIKQLDETEQCSACQGTSTLRLISRTHFYGASDWDDVQFNPGLGVVTKNAKHRAQIAKERGLTEIGNEDFDRTCNSLDKRCEENIEAKTKDAFDSLEYGIKKEILERR